MTDCLVVGAGIAGAAAAYELAASRRVILLEAEPAPGYHSTGRSAALFTPNYGNAVVCALVAAGRSFFEAPPPGFAAQPLLAARGALTIAGPGQRQALGALMAEDGIVEIEPERALELVPILRPEAVAHAAYEPNVMDMDVHAIHQGFLRGLTARGGRLLCDSRVTAAARRGDCWTVLAGGRRFEAPVLVNAAGAWADEVAALAGVAPIGLTPKRRTAAIVDAPDGTAPEGWPMVVEVGLEQEFYFKPEAGRLMVSPGDATPVPPGDAAPDELDVAVAVDWLERTTAARERRIRHKWAGLRTFAADETPVVGPAPGAPGFHWLAGQGGYGIMLSQVLARVLRGLVVEGDLPAELRASGVAARDLSALRLAPGPRGAL